MLRFTDVSGESAVNEATLEDLLQRQKGGEPLFRRLYDIYCEETPRLLQDLVASYEGHDQESCYDIIHQMKGSAAAMGATRMFLITEEALHYSRQGQLFEIEGLIESLREESSAYIEEAGELLARI